MAEPLNVFSIPAGAPFLSVLAEAILDGRLGSIPGLKDDPLALADVTVLLPTRRAVRAFRETLVDRLGRISYTTSVAYGPTIGKNIALAYLPQEYCQVGRKLNVEYFAETYPVEVVGIGYKPLYDPENLKPRT